MVVIFALASATVNWLKETGLPNAKKKIFKQNATAPATSMALWIFSTNTPSPTPMARSIIICVENAPKSIAILFQCLYFDFTFSLDFKDKYIGITKFIHDWSRHIDLITSSFVVVYVNIKHSFVFFPLGHGICRSGRVFIFSTWLNNMFINPRVYYIHVDNTTNTRETRGKEIAEKEAQIRRIDNNHYQVRSQTTYRMWYDVLSTESGWSCTCADHKWRKVCCKHIHAVEFSIKLREEVFKKNTVTIEPITYDKCPECQSSNFVKHGVRHNKNYDLQRYFCNDCKKWFSFNLGFNGIKANPKAVTSALQLYFTGESLRNVQKFLRLQGVEVSHQTVYNWIDKYTELMEKYLEKITPQVSDKWRADEVYVKIRGNKKYLFAMMDDETRFWIAQEVADSKHDHDARSLLKMSKEATKTSPQTFITDGLPAYNEAFRKEFYHTHHPIPQHIRHITIHGDRNNNKMERLNGEFRDREKVFRGLKKEDSPVFSGIKLYHNYVRPHMGLDGQTPADKAGIIIKGDDKWRTLIENASLG